MLIRWNAVDDDAVTHVHHAIKIDDGFGVVGDHDDGLAQLFVELAKHLQHDFGILGIEIAGGLIGEKNFRFID